MKKILFLGDSITDVGRNTGAGSLVSIGQGYALMITGELLCRYPNQYELINRGISGNRIVDVYARIKADCWNLDPDVISILIGVNDVWHEVGSGNGVDARRFENVYRMILCETLERKPDTRFLLLEPFVLKASATEEHWDYFYSEVRKRAEVTQKVSQEFGATFVPLQGPMDEAVKKAEASYWLGDGVHPTPAGHRLIADEWIKKFNS